MRKKETKERDRPIEADIEKREIHTDKDRKKT